MQTSVSHNSQPVQKIGGLMRHHKQFVYWINKAQYLIQLEKQLQSILPMTYRSDCHIMNIQEDKGILVIAVSSAAIATRIRLDQVSLLSQLQQIPLPAAYQFSQVKCKICLDYGQ